MEPEGWARIKALFEQAQGCAAEERERFLRDACGDDDEIRTEVERMLEGAKITDGFLERALFCLPQQLAPLTGNRLAQGEVLCDRFEIRELLGRGGMGEVYAAYDTGLKEMVALKTIRAEYADDERRIQLLRREVQQARRVVHPSVCRVYDLFTHLDEAGRKIYFITMELLRGEPLDAIVGNRGALPVTEAAAILRQICLALAAAHRAGIVHRDLKSANIIVTGGTGNEARVVVTDFGLSRRIDAAGEASTDTGLAQGPAGTLAYMAPEQLEGQPANVRADLYAVGLIAYEILTGRLPYPGHHVLSAVVKRSKTPPPPPSSVARGIPQAWDQCIVRCLDPDPANRFQTADELLTALASGDPERGWRGIARKLGRRAWIAAAALALASLALTLWRSRTEAVHYTSIAVLPFENVGADPQTEYLSDGISEDVINLVAKIGGLRVISRNSSFHFKGPRSDLKAIGRTLGADMIMTGSVRRLGDRLRVTAELIDPKQDSQLWSRSYDRQIQDVFRVQDEILAQVAASLRLQMGRKRLAASERRTQNMEAYDLYLRGRYQGARRDESGLTNAAALLEKAIQTDPSFALAHAELGNCYLLMADYGMRPSRDVLPPARAALLRSIELEPELADGQAVLGQLYALFDWDWQNAERAFKRAIELNPNYAPAYHWQSQFLARMGRWDEGMASMQEALRRDPISIPTNTALGWLYFYSHRFREAKQQAEKTVEMNPYFVHAHVLRAEAAAHLGLSADAEASIARATALSSDELLNRRYAGTTHAILQMRTEALQDLAVLRKEGGARQAAFIGFLCAYLGLADEAFVWLERAYAERDPTLPLVKTFPAMDPYRRDPRYAALLQKLRMPMP
jgi:eukaryotic-like serine/threonine-protein kinase